MRSFTEPWPLPINGPGSAFVKDCHPAPAHWSLVCKTVYIYMEGNLGNLKIHLLSDDIRKYVVIFVGVGPKKLLNYLGEMCHEVYNLL